MRREARERRRRDASQAGCVLPGFISRVPFFFCQDQSKQEPPKSETEIQRKEEEKPSPCSIQSNPCICSFFPLGKSSPSSPLLSTALLLRRRLLLRLPGLLGREGREPQAGEPFPDGLTRARVHALLVPRHHLQLPHVVASLSLHWVEGGEGRG